MDSTFGPLDAFAFVVFAVLIVAAMVIIVTLGKLPGRLARKWGHPQASAVNAAGWIGLATGGLLWPLAFIWAFMDPRGTEPVAIKQDRQPQSIPKPDAGVERASAPRKISAAGEEPRP